MKTSDPLLVFGNGTVILPDRLVPDAVVICEKGRISAVGSIMGMDHMVRIMARDTKAPVHDVIRMASLTPAERSGVARKVGSLAKGKLADVLVLDRKLGVKRVFIGGEEFSTKKRRA